MALSDSNYFHCDDLADVDPFALDPEIAALCDACSPPANPLAPLCELLSYGMGVRVTPESYLRLAAANYQRQQPRVYSGLMTTASAVERETRHRSYRDRLRTSMDRTARDMAALARGKAVA